MASIGHVAVGFSLGSPRWRDIALLSGLALLPDLDALGYWAGVPYASQWGHRGFTHSLLVAALVSVCISRKRFLWCFAAMGSHGLLDAMTTGGLGAALLWPLTDARYFLPWRPIPVAPIGAPSLSFLLREALLFVPFWAIALARIVRARHPPPP